MHTDNRLQAVVNPAAAGASPVAGFDCKPRGHPRIFQDVHRTIISHLVEYENCLLGSTRSPIRAPYVRRTGRTFPLSVLSYLSGTLRSWRLSCGAQNSRWSRRAELPLLALVDRICIIEVVVDVMVIDDRLRCLRKFSAKHLRIQILYGLCGAWRTRGSEHHHVHHVHLI